MAECPLGDSVHMRREAPHRALDGVDDDVHEDGERRIRIEKRKERREEKRSETERERERGGEERERESSSVTFRYRHMISSS